MGNPLPTASPRSPNVRIPPRKGPAPNPAIPYGTPAGKGAHWQQIAAFNNPTPPTPAPTGQPATPPTKPLTPAQQAAQQRQADADARRARLEDEQRQRNQIRANEQGANLATRAGQGINHAIGGTLAPAKRWIEGLPTPGGMGLIIILLLFFIVAIVPVNHKRTRLQLIYLTLTGAEELDDGVYDGQTLGQPTPGGTTTGPGGIIGGPNPGNPFPQGM